MRILSPLRCAVLAAFGSWLPAMAAGAGEVIIDDFGQPASEQSYDLVATHADPLLHKTQASMLGGERDLLVDVIGTAVPGSGSGTIGGGALDFTSTSPVVARLQYDGLDADQLLPTRALVNARGLSVDLTGGGTNDRFVLQFNNLDAGPSQTTLGITLALTGPGAAAATVSGEVPAGLAAYSYAIPFSSFGTAGGFSFANVDSIELTLNSGTTNSGAAFGLDAFSATAVPEPTALALVGALLAPALTRRRRR